MFWGYVPAKTVNGNKLHRATAERHLPSHALRILGIRAGQNTEWKLNCTSRQRRDIRRFMRYAFCIIMVAAALSFPCTAQEWELGAAGGYG